MRKRYTTCCIQIPVSEVEHLYDMQEKAKAVSHDTFVRNVYQEDLKNLEDQLGYTGSNLTLRQDWHVGYYRSTWKNRTCYYLEHSRIEYIFAD